MATGSKEERMLASFAIESSQTQAIAENVCEAIYKMIPDITTMGTSVNSRDDKLYVEPSIVITLSCNRRFLHFRRPAQALTRFAVA